MGRQSLRIMLRLMRREYCDIFAYTGLYDLCTFQQGALYYARSFYSQSHRSPVTQIHYGLSNSAHSKTPYTLFMWVRTIYRLLSVCLTSLSDVITSNEIQILLQCVKCSVLYSSLTTCKCAEPSDSVASGSEANFHCSLPMPMTAVIQTRSAQCLTIDDYNYTTIRRHNV